MIPLLLFLPSVFGQCGTPKCGYVRPYYQQPQVYQAPYVQPHVAVPRPLPQAPDPRLYYTGGYVQPPQIVGPIDKDLNTPVPEIVKIAEYEKFEKELGKLKPIALPEEAIVPGNATGVTYIRELNYVPQPYLPRPLPYRPHPLLPKGCPVLPPQYVQPVPYMPRGYVQPVPQSVTISPPIPPAPVYQTGYVRQYPLNDCCGRCRSPCQFRQRAQARASKTVEKDFVPLRDVVEVPKDSRCTNEELRDIMNKSTTRTPALSKRIIQKVAEEQIGGFFTVICSREDFSYVARSEIFCQTEKNDIICYAFQHN